MNQHGQYVHQNGVTACEACHGLQGQGTVLSTVAATRTLSLMQMGGGMPMMGNSITLTPGQQVSCGLCHANPITQTAASAP